MRCDVGKNDRNDRKIERWLFLWCCSNNAVGEILARYEREKDIRKVVIKIHTMKIADGLLQSKRCPFAG